MSLTQQSIDRAIAQITFVDRKFNFDYVMSNCLRVDDCTRDEFDHMVTQHQAKFAKSNVKLIVSIQGDMVFFEHIENQVYDYLELMVYLRSARKEEFTDYLETVDRLIKTVIE